MSSISRRRNGLMAFSVIGGSCLEGGSRPLKSQDRTPASATSSLATNYRESGLVQCPLADTPRRPADQGLTRRHAKHLLQEDAVVLLLPTRPYASIVDAGRIDRTLSSAA